MRSARVMKKGRDANDKTILSLPVNCVRNPPVARPVDPEAAGRGSKTTTSRYPRTASALASAAPATPPPKIVIMACAPVSKLVPAGKCAGPKLQVVRGIVHSPEGGARQQPTPHDHDGVADRLAVRWILTLPPCWHLVFPLLPDTPRPVLAYVSSTPPPLRQ